MQRIEPPRYPETVQADYAPEEIARLFKTMNGSRLLDLRDRAIVALLYDTGLRGQELCDVRVGDVDRETRRILIRSGKAGKQRLVGYSYETASHLNRYVRRRGGWETLDPDAPLLAGHRDSPLTTDALRLMMGRRFAAAGLSFRGLHAFRRGWAIARVGTTRNFGTTLPRVTGVMVGAQCGSPPHAWGQRVVRVDDDRLGRFTPTRVGTTPSPDLRTCCTTVHPHTKLRTSLRKGRQSMSPASNRSKAMSHPSMAKAAPA